MPGSGQRTEKIEPENDARGKVLPYWPDTELRSSPIMSTPIERPLTGLVWKNRMSTVKVRQKTAWTRHGRFGEISRLGSMVLGMGVELGG